MQIQTIDGSPIATIDGTFEDAYQVAMHFWHIAGDAGVHMDGLVIVDGEKQVLHINYTTHER